jgi:hypothetical protein
VRRRPVADGGVEAEQLHHALAARAPAARRGLAGAARRVVPHQQAQAAARRRVGVGVGVGVGAGAAVVGEDVLEGVHGLAELAVRLPGRPLPRPPLPPLVGVLEELEDLELQRGVVAAREAPALGPLDGGEVLGREARAPQVQPRRVAEPGELQHVHRVLRREPRRHGRLRRALQPPDPVRVRQRQQLRPVRGHHLLVLRRHPARPHVHTPKHVRPSDLDQSHGRRMMEWVFSQSPGSVEQLEEGEDGVGGDAEDADGALGVPPPPCPLDHPLQHRRRRALHTKPQNRKPSAPMQGRQEPLIHPEFTT